jgi:hypothetical protein
VNRAGIALFPEDEVILPGLWEAAVGNSELTVFKTNQEGRRADARHTPRVSSTWAEPSAGCTTISLSGEVSREAGALPADESESTTGPG